MVPYRYGTFNAKSARWGIGKEFTVDESDDAVQIAAPRRWISTVNLTAGRLGVWIVNRADETLQLKSVRGFGIRNP